MLILILRTRVSSRKSLIFNYVFLVYEIRCTMDLYRSSPCSSLVKTPQASANQPHVWGELVPVRNPGHSCRHQAHREVTNSYSYRGEFKAVLDRAVSVPVLSVSVCAAVAVCACVCVCVCVCVLCRAAPSHPTFAARHCLCTQVAW